MADLPSSPRRGINIVGVMFSVLFLTIAVVGLTGNPWWLVDSAVQWIVAGGVALFGLGLVVSTLPALNRSRNGSH